MATSVPQSRKDHNLPQTGAGGFAERVRPLNTRQIRSGKYVLYWMQASQRTEYNHALEYAITESNRLRKPLLVFFGINEYFPEANQRHYFFMLEGLREIETSLKCRGIKFAVWPKSPELGVVDLSKGAALIVTDRGYLRIQREWRSYVADKIDAPLMQVESDVIVPIESASLKEEYSAASLRPKVERALKRFLTPIRKREVRTRLLDYDVDSFDITDVEKAVSRLHVDRSVKQVAGFHGGTQEAKRHLNIFIFEKLKHYEQMKNDPTRDVLSNLSPYLHFGHISPLYVALRVLSSNCPGKGAFLEELIVRRELSMNFVFYNQNYDSYMSLPRWAKETLTQHKSDKRDYVYTLDEFEEAKTHDPFWNAAQLEMVHTGKMHGYMRMYWGKKILEWTESPEEAYRIALELNNKYELDGRDPNGFAGVAWCFGKHDRPWPERPVLGKVRYMNANGLRRKFDAQRYVEQVQALNGAVLN
jgi:deoxyribodipyrimidine photo-lyase